MVSGVAAWQFSGTEADTDSIVAGREGRTLGIATCRRRHQLDMAHAERPCELVQGNDRRIAPAILKTAEILLGKAREGFHVFLRQSLLTPYPGKILTDQSAHVHARKDGRLHTFGLSTIICIR